MKSISHISSQKEKKDNDHTTKTYPDPIIHSNVNISMKRTEEKGRGIYAEESLSWGKILSSSSTSSFL